jgi:hypothetical protein
MLALRQGYAHGPAAVSVACLNQNGVGNLAFLAEGANGSVYYTCFLDDCNAVLKSGVIHEQEIAISVFMGDEDIGPRVLHTFHCDDTGYLITVIITQYLPGTLEKWINEGRHLDAFDADHLVQFMQHAYFRYGLIQQDMKDDNLMIASTTDQDQRIDAFRLIDFGVAYCAALAKRPYVPQEHRGWTGLAPASAHSKIAAAWDVYCLLLSFVVQYYELERDNPPVAARYKGAIESFCMRLYWHLHFSYHLDINNASIIAYIFNTLIPLGELVQVGDVRFLQSMNVARRTFI